MSNTVEFQSAVSDTLGGSERIRSRIESKAFQFLTLPLELRQKVYRYLLPTSCHNSGAMWRRGNTAILATNRQVNDEAAGLLYGLNPFRLYVTYTGILCEFYISPAGPVHSFSFDFLQVLSPEAVRRIRHYEIQIYMPDSYTAPFKYNCGIVGVAAGLRAQVKTLRDAMATAEELRSVKIWLSAQHDEDGDINTSSVILEPFLLLRNVKDVQVLGHVKAQFAETLKVRMGEHEQLAVEPDEGDQEA